EDYWLIDCEWTVEITITQAVWMFSIRLQLEQVDHVDEANPEVRKLGAQQGRGGQRFLGRNVAGARHHDVRFLALVIARLSPDTDSLGAVRDSCIHVQVLQV